MLQQLEVGPPMTSEELLQIAETVKAEGARFDHEVNVCVALGCLSSTATSSRMS